MPFDQSAPPALTPNVLTAISAKLRRKLNTMVGIDRQFPLGDIISNVQQIPIGDTAPLVALGAGLTTENHAAKVPSTIGAKLQRVTINNFGTAFAISGTNYLTFTVFKRDAITGVNTTMGTLTTFTGGVTIPQYVDVVIPLTVAALKANDLITVQVVSTGTAAYAVGVMFATVEITAL